MKTVRLGAGAGYSGDRIEPAVELVEKGDLNYIVFECLAERTIAQAQDRKAADPNAGYDPFLIERMRAVLPTCVARKIKIVSNMGAANPLAAARAVTAFARSIGLPGIKVAAVLGDDVLHQIDAASATLLERQETLAGMEDNIISANAYMGVEGIVEALAAGADVVLTGRVSDPALFLGPLVHEFGWALDDWNKLGQGTLVGHLLECAGQLTGGYFADPGRKDVPDLARLGFPIAEVSEDGSAILSKVEGSGGCITLASCLEQLVYEVLDPAAYIQPDVVADFTQVRIDERPDGTFSISGAMGHRRPDQLKVSIGYRDSFVGEGQISYAGLGALERGRLALDVVKERLRIIGLPMLESRMELIGVDAIDPTSPGEADRSPREVRVRVVVRTATMDDAVRVGNEVETLYTNGPAGGGGVTKSARQVTAIVSTLVDRAIAKPTVEYEVV